MEDGEGRPVLRAPLPAPAHQVVDLRRAVLRRGQHATLLQEVDYLFVRHAVIGLERERKDLPEADAERPNVTFGRVLVVEYTFERHPAYGDCIAVVAAVIVRKVHLLRESKVGDLHSHVFTDQAIPRG